jgi:glycosyltransferase involved in cell wall biosynthesis
VKVVFVTHHAPRRHGSASGRVVFALVEALRHQGHEASAVCWGTQTPPDLPSWASFRPLPAAGALLVKAHAVLRPREDVRRLHLDLRLDLPPDAVVVADEMLSWPAVRDAAHRVANIHNSVALDRIALGSRRPSDLQDLRAERRVVRRAPQLWVGSERVRAHLGHGLVVPYTLPLPEEVVATVEAPVVGMLADWRWTPNLVALDRLLATWPEVRRQVPAAQLVLAGRGTVPLGTLPGVRFLGEVPTSADLLSQVALLAFPCPPTSGPKMKSFDALAHEVAVVTTEAGAEGLPSGAAVVAADGAPFAQALVRLLSDPGQRRERARQGRELLLRHHSPEVAAQARVAAVTTT